MSKKVSELPQATVPLTLADIVPVLQGATLKQAPLSALPMREVLTAARTYYVRTDGSDSNNGLADTAGGAFLTMQKAIDVVAASVDSQSHQVTVQVRSGTRTTPVTLRATVGALPPIFVGDTSTPANVVISVTSSDAITLSSGAAYWSVRGFKLQTTTSGSGMRVQKGRIDYQSMDFGACVQHQIAAEFGGLAYASGNYSVTAGAQTHVTANNTGQARLSTNTITVTGTPAFSSAFASSQTCGSIVAASLTVSGSSTGTRYDATLNGVINTAGGGASVFPGNVSGTTSTGGQYA